MLNRWCHPCKVVARSALPKKSVSALHRTQSRQDVLLHRMKEKPEAVYQANSDARQYSLTSFFSTLDNLVKTSIMIGDRHEAKQPY